jgi:hypothetical protein
MSEITSPQPGSGAGARRSWRDSAKRSASTPWQNASCKSSPVGLVKSVRARKPRKSEADRHKSPPIALLSPVRATSRHLIGVLAERDRVLSAPHTLGMLLLGEPLPGRSALAQREGVR